MVILAKKRKSFLLFIFISISYFHHYYYSVPKINSYSALINLKLIIFHFFSLFYLYLFRYMIAKAELKSYKRKNNNL
jgi:hypothetical protein